MTRYLRIVVAIVFALMACAIIGLWVRSYSRFDAAWGVSRNSRVFQLGSNSGGVVATLGQLSEMNQSKPGWGTGSFPSELYPSDGVLGFRYFADVFSTVVVVPYWFITLLAFLFAALVAFKKTWRFTARGLLIATTLLAAALGLGVYFL